MDSDPSDDVDLATELLLRVSLNDSDTLVTQKTPTLTAPRWALSLGLEGQRDYAHVFRLPNKGGWIRKWVYSRVADTEMVPEAGLANSTTESTTIYRASPSFGTAVPMLSTHWFLCPCQSYNGYTVGLAYMDVALDRLDSSCVAPAECGRFAMDEATGEVFMTAWRGNEMVVAWTQSISSCERVRELLLFEAPCADGMEPEHLILRNSFYERRDCQFCGGSSYPPRQPCHAPAARARQISHTRPTDYLFPLQSAYRRFRGSYYGTVEKTRYARGMSGATFSKVPIVLDLRHGIASVSRRLKINLRQSSVSFGVDPRVSSRMLFVDARRRITACGIDLDSGGELSGDSECSGRASPRGADPSAAGDAKRKRNADGVLDRDSILHLRKVRNRESAARTNEARKRRIQATKAELEDLKTNKVPALKLKEQQLLYENKCLKEMLSSQRSLPDERIEANGDIPLSAGPLSDIIDFPDEVFL